MDALIAEPTAKKKRRSSGASLNKDNNSDKTSISSPKASLPKTFFYKDIIDEKVDQQINDSDNVSNDDNEENSNDNIIASNYSNNESVSEELNEESNQSYLNEEEMGHNITVPEMTADTKSPSNKIKPILTYVKKGIKKNVRFVDKSLIFV
jgi:hypothetical protein